jgi:heptosyltransferase-1
VPPWHLGRTGAAPPSAGVRILIIRLGAFGDIVHTLPLAGDLQAAGHQVSWLCEDRWGCLLEASPAIDRIHRLPRRLLRSAPWAQRMAALLRLLREVRSSGYDAVIDAQGLAKSGVLAALAGGGRIITHAPPRARELSWLAADAQVPAEAVHVIDQQRGLARACGATPAGAWSFPLPPWQVERAWAADRLRELNMLRPWLLNVGAGWPTKVWPEERMVAFARACAGRHPLLLLWGSPDERTVAERIAAASGAPLAPPTTIPRLAGLLAHAAVLVSGDTGPLHLARAVGTPAVGLFGPVPRERNGPQGPRWRNLQAPGAAWERRDVSKVDMGAIAAETVLREAETVAR